MERGWDQRESASSRRERSRVSDANHSSGRGALRQDSCIWLLGGLWQPREEQG